MYQITWCLQDSCASSTSRHH